MIKWPEPDDTYCGVNYYTEAQLKQYGRDVLEEAAKICDAEVQDIHSSDESRNTAEHFASSIRALIKEIE